MTGQCPYCSTHENKRKEKQRKRGAMIIEGLNGDFMLQCAICSIEGRDTAGVSLSKILKEHDHLLHREWEETWEAIANKKRSIEKPFPINKRKDGQKKIYERKSFKEKQAIKSLALEFMQKNSVQ